MGISGLVGHDGYFWGKSAGTKGFIAPEAEMGMVSHDLIKLFIYMNVGL